MLQQMRLLSRYLEAQRSLLPYARLREVEPYLDDLMAALRASGISAVETDSPHERAAAAWHQGLRIGMALASCQHFVNQHLHGRMTRGKGGGRKPGAGRRVGSSELEVYSAFKLTNHNLTKDARCRAAIVAGNLVTAQGKAMSVAAVKKRLQRGTNR
jgi:hypothetical protein